MKSYLLVVTMLAMVFFCDVGIVQAAGGPDVDTANQGLALSDGGVRIFFYGLGAALILFGIASVGYLYRMNRGLNWNFQQSDSAAGDH
jgi:hypothetical protein